MGKYYGIPETSYGWTGFILGLVGMIGWGTQFIWNWYGITDADKALYSILVLAILLFGIAFLYVGNRMNNTRKKLKKPAGRTIVKIVFVSFIGIILFVMVMNGIAMNLDVNYLSYTENNFGLLSQLRQLTAITSEDVGSLQNFALGVRQIVRSMFMIVPALIATWGGLGVLTADDIGDAEGGILAIVAAFVVFIVVWIFKAIDVSLMSMLVL